MVQFTDDAEPVPTVPVRPGGGTPWHVWLVGGASMLWNLMGAADYTFTHLRSPAWIGAGSERMGINPAEMIAYVDSLPAWTHAFWAIGVWGAIVGSLLMLLLRRQAVWAFAASLIGLAVTQVYRAVTPQPSWAEGDPGFNIMLWSVATFLLIYAFSMKRKGVLR